MFKHQSFYLSEYVRRQAMILCQPNRLKPEFTFAVGRAHVDVSRLVTLVGVKVKSKRTDAEDSGHWDEHCDRAVTFQTAESVGRERLALSKYRPVLL